MSCSSGDALPLGLGGRLGPFGLLRRTGLILRWDHPLVPPLGGQPDAEEQPGEAPVP